MLGKKSSLGHLKDYLFCEKKITNVSETQFCQGHTMRWGLAWSFTQVQLDQFDYFKVIEFYSEKKFLKSFLKSIYLKKSAKVKSITFEVDRDSVKNLTKQSDSLFYYNHYKNLLLTDLKVGDLIFILFIFEFSIYMGLVVYQFLNSL